VQISDQSNSSTSPTFANATTTGLLTVSTGGSHCGIKAGSTYINSINSDLILQNNGAIRFGTDSWDYNYWAGLKYVHSSKTISLGLADGTHFTANSAQSGGTMQFPGIGTFRLNGTVHINPPSGSYVEGIRMHPSSAGWTALVFCGDDNTADSGTSAKTWGLFTNGGNFYINKNSSNTSTGYELCNVSGNWGIGTTSPENKLDINGIQQIYQRGNDNTAFKNLLLLKQQNSVEDSDQSWTGSNPSFGIGFRRYWTTGSSPYGETTHAGIYATVSSAWRGGLVFRTKNNETQGGTHDTTALRLRPDGHAIFGNSIETNGSIYITQSSANRRAGIIGSYDPNRAAAIWSMGSSYQIAADGTTLGNLYGAAYVYYGSGYTFGAGKSNGHSFVWCQNGTPYVALGDHLWVKNTGYLGKAVVYDGTNAQITLKTTTAGEFAYLAAYDTGGQYGADVVLHSGSAMVLGAGESAASMYSNNVDSLQGSENLYLTADGDVKVFTNCDTIANRKQVAHFNTSGYAYFSSYINIGGHEKNASSPTYVWGSNDTDSFLRSYKTSSLSVNYATSAGWANSSANANGLESTGYGNGNFTYCQTSNDFFGNSGWSHYLIANHGNGETYFNFTIGLPFWGVPIYKRLESGAEDGWHTFITSENISSQSVNYATSAGNSDLLDGLHESSFVRWGGYNGTFGSGCPASTVKSKFTAANMPNGNLLTYDTAGDEYTLLMTCRPDILHGTALKWGYPDRYIRIIRFTNGVAATTDWEKIAAGYADSSGYATSAGNSDTVDNLHASDFKYVNVNNYSYTPNLAFYDGGSASTNYYKLSITNVNNVWTMLYVEMSIKENYSTGSYGKIVLHVNKNASNTITEFTIHTLGQLSSSVKAYANNNSSSFDIYIAGNWNWPTLNVDRVTFGDSAATATGKNITLTKVTALPSSYSTASVKTGIHSGNYNSYAPKLDGTGATGTWGINITGTATSASSSASLSGGSIATWGTLTAANGYTNVCTWDTGNTTGAFSLAGKGGQMSLQLDGFFYQNEGKYLVLDTNNYSSTLNNVYAPKTITDNLTNFNVGLTDGYINNFKSDSISLSSTSAQITRAGANVSWYQGRQYAVLKTTSYTGYGPVISMKTSTGDWSLGVYSDDYAYLTFITDTNYNNSTNSTTYQLKFPKANGTLATTSDLGSYLPLSGGTMSGTITTPGNDSVVIKPAKNNYDQIGASDCVFWKVFATTFIGSLSGNASSASKLNTDNGTSVKPVYFSGGVPVACSYEIGCVKAAASTSATNKYLLGVTAAGY
jgi:hypothetical protein